MFLSDRLLALPFIFAALPLLFTIPGEPIFSKQFFGLNLTISYAGLVRFLTILIKSWLSVIVSITFNYDDSVFRYFICDEMAAFAKVDGCFNWINVALPVCII